MYYTKKQGDKKVADIGQYGAMDFPTYRIKKGEEYARERRRLYRIRHAGEGKKIGTPGYYAWHLLW